MAPTEGGIDQSGGFAVGADVSQHVRPALARNNVLISVMHLRPFADGPEHRIWLRGRQAVSASGWELCSTL